jgi:hypothetical protein
MTNREFVALAKRYAVDEVVEATIKQLKFAPPIKPVDPNDSEMNQSISHWINDQWGTKARQSKWFLQLSQEGQEIVGKIIHECAENAVVSMLTLFDGVGSEYEGIFEIVAVDAKDRRHLINPQNTEMLHDLFYEVGAENGD